jgi:hypothetical protein
MSKISNLFKNISERVFDTRRLSDFEMIEAPVSTDQFRQELEQAIAKARSEGQQPSPGQLFSILKDSIDRMAVAEVTVTSGVWPLRRSKRVRIFRRSSSPFWSFENGDWTPGRQAEHLEIKWAKAYDYQRQFGLQRSLELASK